MLHFLLQFAIKPKKITLNWSFAKRIIFRRLHIYMYKKIFIIGFLATLLLPLSTTFAKDRNLGSSVSIITRAEWGANEAWRYSKQPAYEVKAWLANKNQQELDELQQSNTNAYLDRKRVEYENTMATDYLVSNYAKEQTIDEVRYEYLGNYLKRPESIHRNKNKIIVHHTAGDYSPLLTWWDAAVKKYLIDVYKYHAITKWWGDIGYHFLIDPFGNIYEGRAGGEWVVAAQTAWNNTPSIGIALMGNFNIQQPTEAQLKSLIKLSTALARKYKIDPSSRVMYFEKWKEAPYIEATENFAVAWHRDAGNTSCPWENLYKLLPDLRLQVKKWMGRIKLTSAVAVTGTTTIDVKANKSQNLWTQVSGFYYSTKKSDTFTLPISISKFKTCTWTDDTMTVNSCSSAKWKLTVTLTKNKFASWIKPIKVITASWTKIISFKVFRQEDLDVLLSALKLDYVKYRIMTSPDGTMNKITHKVTLDEAKTYMQSNVKVLLYDLSNYETRSLSCEGKCIITADGKTYTDQTPIIESHDGFLYLTIEENIYGPKEMTVRAGKSGGLITFSNYKRTSYASNPRNTFRGSITFTKDKIKNLKSGNYDLKYVVINELPFNDYLRGIGETSEQENKEKIKLMGLLAKSYALFYMNPENKHPSIPEGVKYTAIDSPDMFQKYIWAWGEKTFKIYQALLTQTKNQILLYDGYVPILPYFSCSAGFTFSAQEKRWWIDTPYLQSRYDQEKCIDFQGHGVGLSGKGAQYLATQWRTSAQILEYYYPGVQMVTFTN